MRKFANISPYMRRPSVIYDFATAPIWISLYMSKIWFSFLSVWRWNMLAFLHGISMEFMLLSTAWYMLDISSISCACLSWFACCFYNSTTPLQSSCWHAYPQHDLHATFIATPHIYIICTLLLQHYSTSALSAWYICIICMIPMLTLYCMYAAFTALPLHDTLLPLHCMYAVSHHYLCMICMIPMLPLLCMYAVLQHYLCMLYLQHYFSMLLLKQWHAYLLHDLHATFTAIPYICIIRTLLLQHYMICITVHLHD